MAEFKNNNRYQKVRLNQWHQLEVEPILFKGFMNGSSFSYTCKASRRQTNVFSTTRTCTIMSQWKLNFFIRNSSHCRCLQKQAYRSMFQIAARIHAPLWRRSLSGASPITSLSIHVHLQVHYYYWFCNTYRPCLMSIAQLLWIASCTKLWACSKSFCPLLWAAKGLKSYFRFIHFGVEWIHARKQFPVLR
jgi:hypothetical protein